MGQCERGRGPFGHDAVRRVPRALQLMEMLAQPSFVANGHPSGRARLPTWLQRQMNRFGFFQQHLFHQALKCGQQPIVLFLKTMGQVDAMPRQSRSWDHGPDFFVARAHHLRRQDGEVVVGTEVGIQWQSENLSTHG